MVGDGEGSQFRHLLWNALHLTLQASCHHCPGCHFELKHVGFTATYRPRQCLLISRNTKKSIFRAELLEPHGSESCTGHNRDLLRTLSMCSRNTLHAHRYTPARSTHRSPRTKEAFCTTHLDDISFQSVKACPHCLGADLSEDPCTLSPHNKNALCARVAPVFIHKNIFSYIF
jgi:hypothetical protein